MSFPKRILSALNYNEQKVKKGTAECIAAVNYLDDPSSMNFYRKFDVLQRRMELNERALTKTLHVSLNFHPSEKLDNDRLCSIAQRYMEKIGFGEQPFLVYRHNDAAHPHMHIVSTMIREDGSRINTHNLGRTLSEKARLDVEKEFGLVKAGRIRQDAPLKIEPVVYGVSETKSGINGVVGAVMRAYIFASLPEFNAALRRFNVVADRGKEGSRTYKHGGLVFRVLDKKGEVIGTPVKSSLLSGKPTLKNLEKKFAHNKSSKENFKQDVRRAIDESMRSDCSVQQWMDALTGKNIDAVLRKNEKGLIYGVTYVDHQRRVVFNGSELGKNYSAAGILQRLQHQVQVETAIQQPTVIPKPGVQNKIEQSNAHKNEGILDILTSPELNFEKVPFQLRKKKKKKKKTK